MQEPLTLKACGHAETSSFHAKVSVYLHRPKAGALMLFGFLGNEAGQQIPSKSVIRIQQRHVDQTLQRISEAHGGACVICGPVCCSRCPRHISSSRGGPRRMSGMRPMLVLGSCFSGTSPATHHKQLADKIGRVQFNGHRNFRNTPRGYRVHSGAGFCNWEVSHQVNSTTICKWDSKITPRLLV